MCCIFTCCGWMVDLIQRLWTFTMSCFISSAVCCSLVTASMSGVALGYNYSLAEYIDLKETNVSVYLKRGIFDDEIADDMDWRRSGHQPVAGHIGENYLMTGGSDESTTLKSARRLDDSIYESNDRSNFEGSLMRLTAKPIVTSPTSLLTEKTSENVFKQYTMGSIDQLKAVQSLINKQKAEAASRRTFKKPQDVDEEQIVIPGKRPIFPYPEGSGRRAMPYSIPPHDPRSTYNSLRAAVPDDTINEPSKWVLPKRPPAILPIDVQYAEDYVGLTYPSPVTPRAGPVRPTRPPAFARPRSKPTPTYKIVSTEKRPEVYLPKSIDEDIEAFKKKLMEDRFEPPSIKDKDFFKKMEVGKIKANEDYDDDIKGVPLRKKRNIDAVITPRNNFVDGNDTKVDETTDFVTITTKLVDVNNIDSGRTVDKNTILGSGVNKVSLNSEKSPISIIIKLISSAIS